MVLLKECLIRLGKLISGVSESVAAKAKKELKDKDAAEKKDDEKSDKDTSAESKTKKEKKWDRMNRKRENADKEKTCNYVGVARTDNKKKKRKRRRKKKQ